MYHYTESGLDNVWLENGYTVMKTPYGKATSVVDADALHELLAISLTDKKGRITGKEFRFLRTMACLSQKSLAHMVGVSEQALSLWERTGKVPVSGDAVIRMLTLERLEGDGKMSQVIERISTVDRLVNQKIVAHAARHKWTAKPERVIRQKASTTARV